MKEQTFSFDIAQFLTMYIMLLSTKVVKKENLPSFYVICSKKKCAPLAVLLTLHIIPHSLSVNGTHVSCYSPGKPMTAVCRITHNHNIIIVPSIVKDREDLCEALLRLASYLRRYQPGLLLVHMGCSHS